MLNEYITKNGKHLRLGYTTGSCAAAASKAAAIMLLSGKTISDICLITPKEIELTLEILDITRSVNFVRCAVRKDSGDDPDVTDGMMIYSEVALSENPDIMIDGGKGIGHITKPGLNQSVGMAAINFVPRQMISRELDNVRSDYDYGGGFSVIISAPFGEEIARRTFNPRLGIIGGISILGTSGIVEPMSDRAVIDTVKTELNLRRANGDKYLLLTPGNYGEDYIRDTLGFNPEIAVKCSNFIGDALEYAVETGFEGVLLIGHIGKLVKLAGGLFNTHSKYGDCRAEIITTHAARCGADSMVLHRIMDSVTADEMLAVLDEAELRGAVMKSITNKITFLLNARVYGKIKVAAMIFSQKTGLLGATEGTDALIDKIKGE